jgi:hypothetical protein
MTNQQFYRQVSRSTGESPAFLRRRGFSIVNPRERATDMEEDDRPPQVVDWDEVDRERARA